MALGLIFSPAGPPARAADDPSQSGAYCPFPKAGEKPVCFTEVEAEYSDFFAAVEAGEVEGASVDEVERTLAASESPEARTLALSSLAYGYFRLAERAAASDHPDPALVERLESWNTLLSSVYSEAEAEPGLRTAVREAALDLHARAPAVAATDGDCQPHQDGACETTSQLLDALRQVDDPDGESGVRGALGRLLGRMIDDDPTRRASDSSGANAPETR